MTRVRPADRISPEVVATFVAARQVDPSSHITFVGETARGILEELSEVDRWLERLLVATTDDGLAGVLVPEIDLERRRVWWLGPWAATPELALELLDEAHVAFGELFDEEEMAPDSRNAMVRGVARRRGFVEGTWSSVLKRTAPPPAGRAASVRSSTDHLLAVSELHDRIFPGTHTTGADLVAADGTRIRCALVEGRVAAYIAFEIQSDGEGYIDFLGVDPDFRRRGLGRLLVLDACRELGELGVSTVNLTVRADAPGAGRLYHSAGFVEERWIVPCRRGFSLG